MFTVRTKDLIAVSFFTLFFVSLSPIVSQATDTYVYDDLNRLEKVIYDNGKVINYAYDEVGNRTEKNIPTPSVVILAGFVVDYDESYKVKYVARGTCDGGTSTCTYSWTDNSGGTIIGSTDTDTLVVQYSGPGSVSATAAVVSDNCAPSHPDIGTFDQVCAVTKTVNGTAKDVSVDPEPSTATFTITDDDIDTAIVIEGTLDSNIVRVYVYWGDRTRSIYDTEPDGSVAATMDHTYAVSTGMTYNIRVIVVDGAGNRTSYAGQATF